MAQVGRDEADGPGLGNSHHQGCSSPFTQLSRFQYIFSHVNNKDREHKYMEGKASTIA